MPVPPPHSPLPMKPLKSVISEGSPRVFSIVSGAATIFHYKNRRLSEQKGESAAWERRLFDRLTDFLDGFKEVRLNA